MDLRQLIELHGKAERFFDDVAERHADHLSCRSGCSGCCHQSLSLFPVELERLRPAVEALPADARRRLAARLASDDGPCPLLEDDRCVAYEARPIICRTHGAPVLYREDDAELRSVCELNFTGPLPLAALPKTDLLDLDRLNALLALLNRLTVAQVGVSEEREPLREAARRWIGEGG